MDARHALYVGWVLGVGLRKGLPVAPVLDEAGNYTDTIELRERGGGVLLVVPPPPPDWQLDDDDDDVWGVPV
jgi:hypothetical protein